MKNNMQSSGQVHEFAFYYKDFANLQDNNRVVIIQDDLLHRLKNVIRITAQQEILLFDQQSHGKFVFTGFEGKNKIVGFLKNKEKNLQLQPDLIFLVPLLKIDALTDAVYACAEAGINAIQLLVTAKTQTAYSGKLLEKLQRVAIAAAEQSKMFAFPTILPAMQLGTWLQQEHQGKKFYFDVGGIHFVDWYQQIQNIETKYLLVGPEGDLTEDEKTAVQAAGFQLCCLTPTVLRSVRSINLISGLFRL